MIFDWSVHRDSLGLMKATWYFCLIYFIISLYLAGFFVFDGQEEIPTYGTIFFEKIRDFLLFFVMFFILFRKCILKVVPEYKIRTRPVLYFFGVLTFYKLVNTIVSLTLSVISARNMSVENYLAFMPITGLIVQFFHLVMLSLVGLLLPYILVLQKWPNWSFFIKSIKNFWSVFQAMLLGPIIISILIFALNFSSQKTIQDQILNGKVSVIEYALLASGSFLLNSVLQIYIMAMMAIILCRAYFKDFREQGIPYPPEE